MLRTHQTYSCYYPSICIGVYWIITTYHFCRHPLWAAPYSGLWLAQRNRLWMQLLQSHGRWLFSCSVLLFPCTIPGSSPCYLTVVFVVSLCDSVYIPLTVWPSHCCHSEDQVKVVCLFCVCSFLLKCQIKVLLQCWFVWNKMNVLFWFCLLELTIIQGPSTFLSD